MSKLKLTGLLLAAGRSSRFGGHKGLVQLPDAVPMAVRSALNMKGVIDEVLCVVRADDTELREAFEQHGFSVVVAHNAAQGMSESLKAGIEASGDVDGWMVGLGDMPLMQRPTYKALVQGFYAGEGIVVPVFKPLTPTPYPNGQGPEQFKQGHPVIFPAKYRDELLSLSGDTGARAVLKRHAHRIHRVPVSDPGILQDFDTRAAFNELLK